MRFEIKLLFLSKLSTIIVESSEFINPPSIIFNITFPINNDNTKDGSDINNNSSINWVTIFILLIPIDNNIPISCILSLNHNININDNTVIPTKQKPAC